MTDLIKRLKKRIGRRGATLIFLGILDLLFGYSLISAPISQIQTVNFILPVQAWAAIWTVTGAVSLVQAFKFVDRIAFALASTVMIAWGLIYFANTITNHIVRGWVSTVIWISFGCFIFIVSSWPEAPDLHMTTDESDGAR